MKWNTHDLKPPFALLNGGLSSVDSFGVLLQSIRLSGPGRYSVVDGNASTFVVVLYEDGSWRISNNQLELFPTKSAHSIT